LDTRQKRFALYTGCDGPGCAAFGYDSPAIVQGSGYNDSVRELKRIETRGNWSGKLQLDWKPRIKLWCNAGVTRGNKAGATMRNDCHLDGLAGDYSKDES